MPTYDYECIICKRNFEHFQSMSDNSIPNCPKCKSNKHVKKKITAGSGIIFKGSGFYTTDYKNKKKN